MDRGPYFVPLRNLAAAQASEVTLHPYAAPHALRPRASSPTLHDGERNHPPSPVPPVPPLPKPTDRMSYGVEQEHEEEEEDYVSPHDALPKEKGVQILGTVAPPPPPGDDPNLVTWDGPDDPANPQNFTFARKFAITAICAIATVVCTLASSAPSAAVLAFITEFHVSQEVANLTTSIFLLGYVAGPLIWAPGSELIGRRPIFLWSILALVIVQIGGALAKNMATLLVCRFLSGVFSASPITNSGGVIADVWDAIGRGPAMAIFTASTFIGPVCGPIIGSALTGSHLTWRWIFWILMIVAGANLVLLFFLVPETFAPILLAEKAKRLRKEDPIRNAQLYAKHETLDNSPKALWHRTVYRPFHMLAVEPMLQVVTAYTSVVYGLLYALFEAFPIIWAKIRGFTPLQSSLVFIGVGIGTTIGAGISWYLANEYAVQLKRWGGFPPPELRLKGALLAGPFFVGGIFFLGWTGAFHSVPWWVPALATVMVGMSFTLIFISFLTFLVDVYLMYAASALAANTIIRSGIAAAFPLFTSQMFDGLGTQWACTLLGGIGILLAPSPYIFMKYGRRLRERSSYAPCLDPEFPPDDEAGVELTEFKEKELKALELTHPALEAIRESRRQDRLRMLELEEEIEQLKDRLKIRDLEDEVWKMKSELARPRRSTYVQHDEPEIATTPVSPVFPVAPLPPPPPRASARLSSTPEVPISPPGVGAGVRPRRQPTVKKQEKQRREA